MLQIRKLGTALRLACLASLCLQPSRLLRAEAGMSFKMFQGLIMTVMTCSADVFDADRWCQTSEIRGPCSAWAAVFDATCRMKNSSNSPAPPSFRSPARPCRAGGSSLWFAALKDHVSRPFPHNTEPGLLPPPKVEVSTHGQSVFVLRLVAASGLCAGRASLRGSPANSNR